MKEEQNEFTQKPGETHQEHEIRRIKLREEFKEKFRKEIEADENIQAFFKGYNSYSVKSFVDGYVNKKMLVYEFADLHLRKVDQMDTQWVNEAEYHLGIIQQKKLFNLQCLWRAEQIELKDIEIGYDFRIWGAYILECPFIDPITDEDIELYQKYLCQENMDFDINMFEDWQDYDSIKGRLQSRDDSEAPEWFEYYDTYKGTSGYLILPDIRGQKEKKYIIAIQQENHKKHAEKQKQADILNPRDLRPSLKGDYDTDFLKSFIEKYEDKKIKRYFNAYFKSKLLTGDNEEIQEQIDILLAADIPLQFVPASDWQTSVFETVKKYKKLKVIEFLPLAFEQYKLKAMTGNKLSAKEVFEEAKSMRGIFTNLILNGREFLGEPRNFDF